MKQTAFAVCLTFALPLMSSAADLNTASLRGRVLSVQNHIASGGVFRVEVTLYDQAPSGGPYSPSFYCSPLIWGDCEVADLITGCSPVCDTVEGAAKDSKVEVCACATFNPGAGVCLETAPYHDGFGLLATSISILAGTNCTAVP
jgi:hypothetical protein